MTPEEINIAIAKSLGYTYSKDRDTWLMKGDLLFKYGDHFYYDFRTPPNCHADLNAIQEAVLTLQGDDQDSYNTFLINAVYKATGKTMSFHTLNATAPQRCEAYLKAKGLWKNTPVDG